MNFYKRIFPLLFSLLLIGLFTGAAEPQEEDNGKKINYWTCGMHPSVKAEEPGDCPICGMDLVPVYAETEEAETEAGETEKKIELVLSPRAARLANIRTVPVTRRKLVRTIRAPARIAYDETGLFHISARFEGRIEKLYADHTGKKFERGAPLARIYSPELISAQKEYLLSIGTGLENSAREKLILWGISENQIMDLRQRGEVLRELIIHAPAGGTVVKKEVMEGHYVKEGSPLFLMADLSSVWALAEVFEEDLHNVRVGQKAEVLTSGTPSRQLEGRISFIQPSVDIDHRSAEVRVELDNRDERLFPGMFVTVEIKNEVQADGAAETGETGKDMAEEGMKMSSPEAAEHSGHTTHAGHSPEKKGVLAVPRSAVINTGVRTVVFVAGEGNSYFLRNIVIGDLAEGHYTVLEGLKEGEMVVEEGAFLLDSQARLSGQAEEIYGGALGKESGEEKPRQHRH